MRTTTDILPASQRPFPVSRGGRTCYGFQWIGQPFSSCDNCGHPQWEHSHYLTVKPDAKLFGKSFRKIITVEDAEACRRKWGW